MKRAAYILGFALLALMLGYACTAVFAWWYVPRYAHGHDGGGNILWILLNVWLCSLVIGGIIGDWFFQRKPGTPLTIDMKRTAYILGFALLALLLGYALMRVFERWYMPRYSHDENGVGHIFAMLLLMLWPSLFVIGGLIGNWLLRKNLTRRSTGRAKAARR